jgi:hypothetical protein
MNEKTYPSDLTDEEWEWIKELIPAAKSGGRPRTLWMRAVLNAIFYVTKGGIQWRMLPTNFPQVAERLSLLARLETPGGVGQNPRYVTRTRPSKRGEAQTSHGRVSG